MMEGKIMDEERQLINYYRDLKKLTVLKKAIENDMKQINSKVQLILECKAYYRNGQIGHKTDAYPEHIKQEVLALYLEGKITAKAIAKKMKVNQTTVCRWIRTAFPKPKTEPLKFGGKAYPTNKILKTSCSCGEEYESIIYSTSNKTNLVQKYCSGCEEQSPLNSLFVKKIQLEAI